MVVGQATNNGGGNNGERDNSTFNADAGRLTSIGKQ